MARRPSDISDKYSTNDIERALDRIAEEIAAHDLGKCLIPLFEWLEDQLEIRRRRDSTLERVRQRVAGLNKAQ